MAYENLKAQIAEYNKLVTKNAQKLQNVKT